MNLEPTTRRLTRRKGRPPAPRNRRARHPWQFSAVAWKDILWRTARSLQGDRTGLMAGGVAFYLMLSLVPLFTTSLAIYGMLFDVGEVAGHIDSLRGLVPAGVIEFFREELERLTGAPRLAGWSLLFSILVGLWGASRAHQAIAIALDLAYGETSSRGMIGMRLSAIALAAATICTGLLMLGLVVVVPGITAAIGGTPGAWLDALRWPLVAAAFWGWLMVTYRYGPSRR
ncbi:MAG: YihY/virulence factor BrkB family protein, partial [Akkermansiaceae bacterium]|nr:YihY/virulence factor BrkB family protein [Akkermansiaceae bacterium]